MIYGTGGFAYGGGSAHLSFYDYDQRLFLGRRTTVKPAPVGRSEAAWNTL